MTGGREPQAAQRALALLEAVARLGSGATARDISRLSGIPPATAYRLLNVLVADGYLVRIADLSGFALGRRTRDLAGAAPTADADAPLETVPAVLEELRSEVRFGIFVASFAGDRIRFVDRDPDHELGREGLLVAHPHASAVGKLLLARRPHAPSAPLRRFTARTVVDPAALAVELDTVRATGIAHECDELRVGRSAVAVAVHDGAEVVGGLAAIGRTGRVPVDDPQLVELLQTYAQRVREGRRVPLS